MSADVESDFNACDDFFVGVLKCHIVAAAMQYFNMTNIGDTPVHPMLKDDLWLESVDIRKDILQSVCTEVVLLYGANFLNLTSDDDDDSGQLDERNPDKVQCYATELLSYGLLYLEFSDAIREATHSTMLALSSNVFQSS